MKTVGFLVGAALGLVFCLFAIDFGVAGGGGGESQIVYVFGVEVLRQGGYLAGLLVRPVVYLLVCGVTGAAGALIAGLLAGGRGGH
jgi:hypothetical protein